MNDVIKVLLIDDNHTDYVLIDALLKDAGVNIQLDHVSNAAAAWQAFQANAYDVYLLNYLLDSKSSLEMLERLKAQDLYRAVIVLTGQENDDVDRRAMQAGASDFLVKGRFDTDLLVRVVRYAAERQATLERLYESETRYALAVSGANDGIWDWNLSENRIYFSPRWKEQLGYRDQELPNNLASWFDHVHKEDLADLRFALDEHLNDMGSHLEFEYRVYHKDGSVRWMLCRGLAVYEAEQKRIAGSQTDITSRKEVEAQILHDAFHDPLTTLANRALFINRLDQLLEQLIWRQDQDLAVILLDIDRFKIINDSLGYEVGDKLICAIAERLQGSLRPADSVAHFGGDDFAILLERIFDRQQAMHVAERLLRNLAHPFPLGIRNHVLTASVGIAFNQRQPEVESAEILLRNAEIAMYQAKNEGGNAIESYQSDMYASVTERLQLEADLREALEKDGLSLNYQPLVDLKTQRIVGFEALVRWIHPKRGFVPPSEFIPLAEETGLIVALGYAVLEKTCQETRTWQDKQGKPVTISVNLSSRQFSDPALQERTQHILETSYFEPDRLRLEITETAIMENPDGASEILMGLKPLGVKIYMDDFGTGYSSLSYLHRFPLDTLKIDRSFVKEMDGNESLEIIRSIIILAQNLDMDVVAEGIEHQRHAEQLLNFGCHYGQGYLFSKPVEASLAIELLQADLHNPSS